MNIIQIFQQFPTQESCIKYLEQKRWGNKPICPYCQSTNTYPRKDLRHHCNGCIKSFSVTVGTIFHDTRLPLQKWFLLIALMLNAKKGLSACQAARDLNMRRPTVWSMMHRIRKAMKDQGDLLCGIVEMDESYIGGKPRKKNRKEDDNNDDDTGSKRGRGTDKTPVVGVVERRGNVKAQAVNKENLKGKDLRELVRKWVHTGESILVTDEYTAYNRMCELLPHVTINHSREYARGDVHTNTIESFWAIVKRGIVGQFHKVSKKYLNTYLNEFTYRYNARNTDSNVVFDDVLGRMLFLSS